MKEFIFAYKDIQYESKDALLHTFTFGGNGIEYFEPRERFLLSRDTMSIPIVETPIERSDFEYEVNKVVWIAILAAREITNNTLRVKLLCKQG